MMPAAATALVAVYVLGYVSGALLVSPEDRPSLPWTVIRVITGLLLSTLAFLLSLVLAIPWFIGPIVVVAAALARHRWTAFSWRPQRPAWSWPGALAIVAGGILLSPILISALRMAPGDVAPVFFNVDTAYSLEQVQSLTKTRSYPPESLSNLGGGRSYHFGTMGMAALISRTSGLQPHRSLFLIVLPLLTAGILAGAVEAARSIAPAVPAYVTVPLLLIAVPSFWYSFWDSIGPLIWAALSGQQSGPIREVVDNVELWGPASIVSQNVGAHALVLATLAAVAAAPSRGWRLAVFLLGTGIMVKVSTGVALAAGFLLAQAYEVVTTRQLRSALPGLGVAAVLGATYAAFWILPETPPDFSIEVFPLFHLRRVAERMWLPGLLFDIAWVLLPAALVALARIKDPERRSLPLLLFAIAPFLVVNLTQSIDQRPGGGGASDDWLQVLLPAPFMLHAFVIACAGARWTRLPRAMRPAFITLLALSIVPAIFVAGRYSRVLVNTPENGHEFVDNRSIAEALAAVPAAGTIIVTNDLRYPAQRFSRDNRQMQIPALYGHQAFAVNYAYEVYSFSRDRRELQKLLQADAWSNAIVDAALTHGWTHLLIRKDYPHPAAIPLERIFENADYEVYRFATGAP